MSEFKGRHFKGDFILWAVRWYCKFGVSYRELETMLTERGFAVDHSTIYRWVQNYVPKIEKKLRWYWRRNTGRSWRVDETYLKVKGKWTYLYRAVDTEGHTIDFYLSRRRNTNSAKIFLAKAIKGEKEYSYPKRINFDKSPTYPKAILKLKEEGKWPSGVEYTQIKFLNNRVESDHAKMKRLIGPTYGFKSMKTAYATIKGFEVMRMFKKGQLDIWKYGQGVMGEVRLVNQQFGIYG